MQFPHSCILYLRGDNQKKTIEMELLFPDGQTVLYNVPVIRMKWYSIEEIFRMKDDADYRAKLYEEYDI